MIDHKALVQRCLAAYPAHDRAAVDRALAPDFRFTSPYDDAIDRATYFERCWPNHTRMKAVNVERIVDVGDAAYVTYELVTTDDRHIHNTELFTFDGDQIATVHVFFGEVRDRTGAFQPMTKD